MPETLPEILVVDDEPRVRMMVTDSLEDASLRVIEAQNADEAVGILASGAQVDLMLSDVRMPGTMDGLALLRWSKTNRPDLPVIIMSGHLAATEALEHGAAHFLGKPYSFPYALTLIKQELARATGAIR